MDDRERARALVQKMTLREKASLCSGADNWHLKGVRRLGLPSVMVTDGPHGLRKQTESASGTDLGQSVPATCFPPAATTACSFDRALLTGIGAAIGEECREEDVSVVLGPGLNIKRSPLCGRNFEYFSEDPFLSGELAAAMTDGVQSQGVGVSLKHFALNNQETRRMTVSAECDERAMRELYLAGFERAVKKAAPWTVMSAYNRIGGVYAGENRKLLTEILREEWGFSGLVMSDWGGTNDRVAGVLAGLDLEMPGLCRDNDRRIARAVRRGVLPEAAVDRCAERVTELIVRASHRQKAADTKPGHHELARRAAMESAVLLKNDGALLPIRAGQTFAVVGAAARTPRYQGAGSSRIQPTRLDNAMDALYARGLTVEYAAGYDLETDAPDEARIEEACRIAAGKDLVCVFAALPDRYESEGYDRETLRLPENQTELIRRVAKVNPHVAVVLAGGSVIDLSWAEDAEAILMCYLGGQGGAWAAVALLLGEDCPSGKLAESWPMTLADCPTAAFFPGTDKTCEYRESIFVGYRYYDAANKPVRYPFGYGLSYTTFVYDNLTVEGSPEEGVTVGFDVKNTGACDGAEIAELYVSPPHSVLFRAPQELKGFEKVFLCAGESRHVELTLDARAFAYYDVGMQDWRVESGVYGIRVGASSRDIRLTGCCTADNPPQAAPTPDYRQSAPCYYHLEDGPLAVDDASFAAVLGRAPVKQTRKPGDPFTVNSTLTEITEIRLGRGVARLVSAVSKRMLAGATDDARRMFEGMLREAPLRMLQMAGWPITPGALDALVRLMNRRHAVRP